MASQISKLLRKWSAFRNDESGVVIIIIALLLPILLGFAGLVIDVGYMMVTRNELQNAADAAALSGAGYFWYNNTSGTPNWSAAQTAASTTAPPNKSGGTTIVDYEIQAGYWNLAHTPPGLQPTSITPGANDVSAVQVTVRKAAGKNGGPLNTFFGSFIGKSEVDVGATATAISASPGAAKTGALLPMAITKAVADQKSSYKCGTGTFRIGSSYHYPTSEAGQWTSFDVDSNNVPFIRDLIANGNPTTLDIGDSIWIQPGTKTTLYSSVPVPADVVLPVVNNIDTHAWVPIVGFICFHITNSVGGSGKYVEGCFNDSCYGANTGGINPGPNYGVYAPPALVQ
jgi:Flp pilus assembly protein TadG